MKNTLMITSLVLAAIFTVACNKEMNSSGNSSAGTAPIKISMTDGPGNFEEVNINIQQVEIITESEGTITLIASPGMYNLLKLSNGKDTVIATGNAKVGRISQIRLILGDGSNVVVDGQTYDLATPSAEESGLKVQLNDSLQEGVQYALLLDFDAGKSIVKEGNGHYLLKPVLRVVDVAISGSIAGSVDPAIENVAVTAAADSTAYTTVTNANGDFLLKGIPQGTYTVTITKDSLSSPIIINNVSVSNGQVTDLQTIAL